MPYADRTRWFKGFSAFAAALAVGSCGGGNSTQTPTPQNRAPVFTSLAAISVVENTAAAIYAATATDADGDPLTFTLSGGQDQGFFRLTAGGALSFATPPDFEFPLDADRNNIYLVQIGVSDGTTSATLDLAVTVTNNGPDGFRVVRVGTGFSQPLFVAPIPDGSGRVLVVEKEGRIRILNPATGVIAATPFLDLSGQISIDGERGLLGVATAPDFASSGTFYVYLTNTAGNIELRRYRTLAGNRDQADVATADVILLIPHPTFRITMAAGSILDPAACSSSG